MKEINFNKKILLILVVINILLIIFAYFITKEVNRNNSEWRVLQQQYQQLDAIQTSRVHNTEIAARFATSDSVDEDFRDEYRDLINQFNTSFQELIGYLSTPDLIQANILNEQLRDLEFELISLVLDSATLDPEKRLEYLGTVNDLNNLLISNEEDLRALIQTQEATVDFEINDIGEDIYLGFLALIFSVTFSIYTTMSIVNYSLDKVIKVGEKYFGNPFEKFNTTDSIVALTKLFRASNSKIARLQKELKDKKAKNSRLKKIDEEKNRRSRKQSEKFEKLIIKRELKMKQIKQKIKELESQDEKE